MTQNSTDQAAAAGQEALDILRLMIGDENVTAAARVAAAKALLERFTPKEDAELKRREADERASAIAEARCLLAALASAEPPGDDEPPALAFHGAAGADNPAFDVIG